MNRPSFVGGPGGNGEAVGVGVAAGVRVITGVLVVADVAVAVAVPVAAGVAVDVGEGVLLGIGVAVAGAGRGVRVGVGVGTAVACWQADARAATPLAPKAARNVRRVKREAVSEGFSIRLPPKADRRCSSLGTADSISDLIEDSSADHDVWQMRALSGGCPRRFVYLHDLTYTEPSYLPARYPDIIGSSEE